MFILIILLLFLINSILVISTLLNKSIKSSPPLNGSPQSSSQYNSSSCSKCDGDSKVSSIEDLGCTASFYDCCQSTCTSKNAPNQLKIEQCNKFGTNPKLTNNNWASVCNSKYKTNIIAMCTVKYAPKLIKTNGKKTLYIYGNFIYPQLNLKCGDYLTGIIRKCGNMDSDIDIVIKLLSFKRQNTNENENTEGWRGLRLMVPGASAGANPNGCINIFPKLYQQQCMASGDENYIRCQQYKTEDKCSSNDCYWGIPIESKTKSSGYINFKNGIQNKSACNLLTGNTYISDSDNELIKTVCEDIHIDIFGNFPYGHVYIDSLKINNDPEIVKNFNKYMNSSEF